MKNLYIWILAFLLISVSKSNSQSGNEKFFYYYKEKKQSLELEKKFVYISFKPGFSKQQISDLAKKNNISLASVFEDKEDLLVKRLSDKVLEKYWAKVELQSNKISDRQFFQIIEGFKKMNEVDNASPYFKNLEGVEIGLTSYLLVKLKDKSDLKKLQNECLKFKCKIVGYNEFMPQWYTLSCDKESIYDALELSNILYESELFASTEPSFVFKLTSNSVSSENSTSFFSNDTYFTDQWGHKNTGQNGGSANMDLKIEDAWTITTGNPSVKVAVFDSGIQMNHIDLFSNVDTVSYNSDNNSSPSVFNTAHGTACAGIIAAVKDNGVGIAGVAPNAKLISLSIDFGSTNNTKLANGINWAVNYGASIISNSWGGGSQSSVLDDAISNALINGRNGLGTIIVFASGNNNSANGSYPGNSNPLILNVGAVDRCGVRSGRIDIIPQSCDPWSQASYPGSSYGSTLDVVAPGTAVATADLMGTAGYNTNGVSNYSNLNFTNNFGGTSSACPYVSGVVALVLSLNPNLNVLEVNNIIEMSAQKARTDLYGYSTVPGRVNGVWNNQLGYGLVNAYAALVLACPQELNISTPLSNNVMEISAESKIVASNTILNGSRIVYHAGDAVIMNPGFNAVYGSIYSAYIEGCSSMMLSALNREEMNSSFEVTEQNMIHDSNFRDELRIFPNPSSSSVDISLGDFNMSSIIVTSMDGRLMFDKNVKDSSSYKLDISNYTAGIYMVTATTGNGKVFTGKIIKN